MQEDVSRNFVNPGDILNFYYIFSGINRAFPKT